MASTDRKSTRLNSSHANISYAVFCLKKKNEVCTVNNDLLKVNAIVNQIKGFRDDGKTPLGTPTVLGMNFQPVSVGQKLSINNPAGGCPNDPFTGQVGGYTDGEGMPATVLAYGLQKTDDALRMMIN